MGERNLNTPLMKQYLQFKAEYPDCVLLMRVGDFYEAYGDDALIVSKVLNIVLTKRSNGTPGSVELCGFPYHSIETYLPKLVRGGYKVAVCDQLEDPKLAKSIVKRGVTEVVTPGVAYGDNVLDHKKNNFLAALYFVKDRAGVAFADVSTGEFKITEGSLDYIDVLLGDFMPTEVLLEKPYVEGFKKRFGSSFYITTLDEWAFVEEACEDKLKRRFGENALKGFGIKGLSLAKVAAGAILFYLEQNRLSRGEHLTAISRIDSSAFLWIDKFTAKNLELLKPISPEGTSLIEIIDHTSSPMGARLLRSWISMPLVNTTAIDKRLDCVDFLLNNEKVCTKIRALLSNIGDLERITARAAVGKITPREVVQLRHSIENSIPLSALAKPLVNKAENLNDLLAVVEDLSSLATLIEHSVVEEPATAIGRGNVIATGVNKELDELRTLSKESKQYLLDLQAKESVRTGIPSLKIGYNNVFGYYLEVRNTHKESIPKEWTRKQTLVSAERYITPELKEYEEKILGAQEKIAEIEQSIFTGITAEIQKNITALQLCGKALGEIDCFTCFAHLAHSNHYCRPVINNSNSISIKQGRHPVLEKTLPAGEEYVANDLFLSNDSQQIIILTGPNMSGKSALLRQTALIVLLAQCGCFVPAEGATIGICDKIFTRVGASDNISQGESTFMVEMIETSAILHNLSERSLILLDEIGRGTGTFDGMSIAYAIVEYLHQNCASAERGGPKTIFATHYHELNSLEKIYPRVKNWHIAVKDTGDSIIFLRKLCRGGETHSFGIHVARMAGMPLEVIESATKRLKSFEAKRKKGVQESSNDSLQLSFFQLDDPTLSAIRDKLKGADLNNMTPMDAFDLLRKLRGDLGL